MKQPPINRTTAHQQLKKIKDEKSSKTDQNSSNPWTGIGR